MLYFDGSASNKFKFKHSPSAVASSPYVHYSTSPCTDLPSLKTDLVIWPEFYTPLLDSFPSPVQTSIWWLSVDNNNGDYKQFSRPDVRHFCQSKYALQFLRSKGAPPATCWMLTEYIHPSRSPTIERVNLSKRSDVVLYNPAKGAHYTDQIRSRSEPAGLTFVPIQNLTPSGVTDLLLSSKVYIDFGNHPGMDRLPREAALAGLVVVTNKEGAAKYDSDVPIPEEFKFGRFDVDKIHEVLKSALADFTTASSSFAPYRSWILKQERVMDFAVARLRRRLARAGTWEEEENANELEAALCENERLEEEAEKGRREREEGAVKPG